MYGKRDKTVLNASFSRTANYISLSAALVFLCSCVKVNQGLLSCTVKVYVYLTSI